MANIAPEIFKAYDIRGIVGETLTDEAAMLIGKAIASEAVAIGVKEMPLHATDDYQAAILQNC